MNQAEAELIETGRVLGEHKHHGAALWRALASSPNVWCLCLAYLSNSYGSYFVMTWLPTYLAENRGFEKQSLSLFAGLPLLLSVFGDISGGAVTDWAVRAFGLRLGRIVVCVAGYAVAAAAMLAAVYAHDARDGGHSDCGGGGGVDVHAESRVGRPAWISAARTRRCSAPP